MPRCLSCLFVKAVADCLATDWVSVCCLNVVAACCLLLQVGAAAVGGATLFAVTGGLAAPAIAAGVASILGFIGAPTAIAGTVTGFLASSAGAAAVTTTMAGAGALSTSGHMAHRVAGVSEFGFVELLPTQQRHQVQETPLVVAADPTSAKEGIVSRQLPSGSGGSAGDLGHLQGGGGYAAARAQAMRQAGSTGGRSGGGADGIHLKPQQSPVVQPPSPPPQQQVEEERGGWRWFGKKEGEEELLLPVPMRARCAPPPGSLPPPPPPPMCPCTWSVGVDSAVSVSRAAGRCVPWSPVRAWLLPWAPPAVHSPPLHAGRAGLMTPS